MRCGDIHGRECRGSCRVLVESQGRGRVRMIVTIVLEMDGGGGQ